MRGHSECGWWSRQAMESHSNASLCTGIWPPWDLPELCRYTLLKLLTSNVQVLLLFYFPKPNRFCIGQELCSCPGFGLFSLSESETCLQGNCMQWHLCVSGCLRALSQTCLQTQLVCVTGWTRGWKGPVCPVTTWTISCPVMVLLFCQDAGPCLQRMSREVCGGWLASPLQNSPQQPSRAVASSSEQSQKQVPWFLYPVLTEIFQACMI